MDQNEFALLTPSERNFPDCSGLPPSFLLKSLLIKLLRKLLPRPATRMVWTISAVNDIDGPAANVRNYLERRAIRSLLDEVAWDLPLKRACEIGCGYGRVTMVLKEYANTVRGFEREPHLVAIARSLLPEIEFTQVDALTKLTDSDPYDLVMSCTVLQHLTDEEAGVVCGVIRRLAPAGHALLIEKTMPISVTTNKEDGSQFLSRARTVGTYQELMAPFSLIISAPRRLEPSNPNLSPGTLMLFKAP